MRILVIEDDPALASSLRFVLAGVGYAPDVAQGYREAELLWKLNPYDAVLLDLKLPDGDGHKLLEMMRSDGKSPPVLIISARDAVEDRIEGLDAGADDYLSKPFSPAELVARVRALLRRPHSWTPPAVKVGNVVIDRGVRKVSVGDSVLGLTSKEWSLLEYLSANGEMLVTRSSLLDHCWDNSYEGISNLVDVHIGRLRRKLQQAGASCRIETVRNAGFILRAD
jgi:DNA-binding response OmpR family regulator